MKKTKNFKGKRLLVLGLLVAYMCMATACTGRNDENSHGSGDMAGTNQPATPSATSDVNHNVNDVTSGSDTITNDTVGGAVEDVVDGVTNGAADVVDGVTDGAADIVDGVTNGVSDVTNGTNSTTGGTR